MTGALSLSRPRHATATVAPDSPVPVLIVDDNASKRLALKSVLLPLGYHIVEADSGVDALRCVMAQDFAVILLDVCMPLMDGFEAAALIRQRWQSEMTPIIFITARSSDEIAQANRYSEGAVDFIFAPVPPADLRAKVSVFANLFIKAELLATQAREVQASVDQLRLLTDAAPIGIFQTDDQNLYVYTNPRWTEITGISCDQATGRRWDIILDAAQRKEHTNELGERAEICHRFELRHPAAGSRIVLVTSRPIPDSNGAIAGWVGTLADVTAEAGAEAAMTQARDAALSATARQRAFTSSASHELRTPTTSIVGFVEAILESTTLSTEDRGFLEIVDRNAHRLSQLIDDLLVLGQVEIGPAMMHLESTALRPLVERVMSMFPADPEQAAVTLIADEGDDLPAALVDPVRLEQALINIVSNAIKFTPKGGVVEISVRNDADTAQVSVADTGMGIEATELDRIFDRFYRSTTTVDAAVKGTGLGLAIAKKMIEAQNGQIDVASVVGRGSTFTITFPRAPAALQVA